MVPTRAVVLARISDDKAGEEHGVARQEADGRKHGARLGWGIGEVVVENDTSAFKRRKTRLPDGTMAMRVIRPGFRRVIEMLSSGEADGLIAIDLDRVARDPRDLEDLIDVVELSKVPVTSVTGSLRLDTDADITMARVMVAIANKSSRDTSRRVTRNHEALAEQGKPGGGGYRGYGYSRDGLEVVEAEAEVIRDIAKKILGDDDTPGMSMKAIARDLNDRGIPTVRGGEWQDRSVYGAVTKPKTAGLRVYRGEIVGKGVWPAILERDVWEDVLQKLQARSSGHQPGLKRWLSRVMKCSLCGRELHSGSANNGPRYWCSTEYEGCGKIAIKATAAEEEIERQVLELLTKPKVLEQLRKASDSDALEQARQDLAIDEAQLKEMAEAYAKRQLSFPEYMVARRIVDARVKEARLLVVSSAPRILRRLLDGDVREEWLRLEPADKRDAVLALVPGGFEVAPHEKGAPTGRFDPTRIRPLVE